MNTSLVEIAKTPKPFQFAGAEFLTRRPHALLADEPGLGKTLQAIYAVMYRRFSSILVVCPASVRNGWRQEISECAASGEWDVLSYEQVVGGYARRGNYTCLILDEAHYLKTPDSARTQAVFGPNGVARDHRLLARWCLTGTPVLNRPRELFPLLKNLHGEFAEMSWAKYTQRYCGAYFNGREMDTRGSSNLDELKSKLNGFMLRRTKDEVAPELPARIVSRVPLKLKLSEQTFLDGAEKDIISRESKISAAAENFSALGDLATLLHRTGQAKVAATASFIRDLLETQEKVVVFFKHTDVGEQLREQLRGYAPVMYQGGMGDLAKKAAICEFAGEFSRVILLQIQAGGTGINGLQDVCGTVVFAELDWVPGVMEQAVDRLHRMGQKAPVVNAYLLHVPGSMESAVLSVQNSKGTVVGKLMGEKGWNTK